MDSNGYVLLLRITVFNLIAMWLLTGRQLHTFIGQGEQEIPNKIEGIPSQALFLEKLKKTLHKFKQC